MFFRTASLPQLGEFDEIIDVRTPAEFAEDHIPGAVNCPVLSDAERVAVGTLYRQVSPFEARKMGAALVARNIAQHLETHFRDRPKSWKPLVYCWRGGQRSGAMCIVLAQVGWAARQLEGGYKAYRRDVLEQLDALPRRLAFQVVCGPTGSGKSRLLAALASCGRQVLDLEALARHRGSVLGRLPERQQPNQKQFDSALLQALQRLDPAQPVYVEAESNRIGSIALPEALSAAMHAGSCLLLETSLETRIAALLEDYRHYLVDPEMLIGHLQALHRFHGGKCLEHWTALIRAGDFATLAAELLELHYDPGYLRATTRHYPGLGQARHLRLDSLAPDALREVAATL